MTYCINCGKELVENAKFCFECGTAVQTTENERRTMYEGEIHKCPNCGDIIDAFEFVCDNCGYEIRSRKTSSVVHELSLKLEETNDEGMQKELIRNFYIPNTKEDILEFMILALSNLNNGSKNESAWNAKFEHAYQKSKMLSETTEIEDLYSEYLKRTKKVRRRNKRTEIMLFVDKNKKWIIPTGAVLMTVILIVVLVLAFSVIPENKRIKELDSLVEQVEIHIGNGNYSTARMKANQIIYDGNKVATDIKYYEIREKLLIDIDNAEALSIGQIRLGISYSEGIGSNYETIIEKLNNNGFNNISTDVKYDIVTEWIRKDGEISEITVGGTKNFDAESKFLKNIPIVITYHTFK